VSGAKNGNGHKLVSLDDLLALPLPFEDVDVPEYGEGMQVRLYAVTGLERASLAKSLGAVDTDDSEQNLRYQHVLIAATLHSTPDKVASLTAPTIDRLSNVALRLAGLSRKAEEEAEAVLKVTPSGDSG
jgi:hypothetical protein